MKKIMTLAAVAILMAACNNETEVMDNTSKYITVDANVAGESRVAAKDAFADGNQIRVYAWTGSADELPDAYVVNSVNTKNGANWTADKPMLWKDGSSAHYFLGIYPALEISGNSYDLEANGELLIATNFGTVADTDTETETGTETETVKPGITPTSNPISLAFDHVMSKFHVNLIFRDEWSDITDNVTIQFTATKDASINYLNKTAAAASNGTTHPYELEPTTGTADYDLSYETILVPQELKDLKIVIKIDENTEKTYTYSGPVELKTGKVTILNLKVGRDEVTLANAITINGWGTSETIKGEVQ